MGSFFFAILVAFVILATNAFILPSPILQRSSALNVRIKVVVGPEEPLDNALKTFKKIVNQSGHLMELRFREFHESNHDKRKRRTERAAKLNRIERTNDKYERRAETGNEYD